MSAVMSSNGQDAFKARLKKIERRGENTVGQVYVGMGGSVSKTKAKTALRSSVTPTGRKAKASFIKRFCGFLIAGLLGALAVLIVRFVLFKLLGVVSPMQGDMMQMFGYEAGGAAGIALLLAVVLGTLRKMQFLALALGLVLSLGLTHNLVHMQPDLFARAFSPEWVAMVQDTSVPRSIVLLDKMMLF